MKVSATRRENLRALIGERGGLTDLSNRLGYSNPRPAFQPHQAAWNILTP